MAEHTIQHALTGDDIIAELVRNLESGQFKIRQTVLVPCIFDVYLHNDDYDTVKPIITHLRGEAKDALREHLEALNEGKGPVLVRWMGLGSGKAIQYKILEPDWSVDFYPDAEGSLQRGEIEIYSKLAQDERPDFDVGAMTTNITRRGPEGETSVRHSAAAETDRVKPTYAVIRFEQNGSPRSYHVSKDVIVIGRGGKTHWVDLRLEAPADVSREHCRIRRDPATGNFYLKDVSSLGTSIDGKSVPSSLERTSEGESKDANIETQLPARARIGLADALFFDWEAS